MPKYEYTALDVTSNKVTGAVDAHDEAEFRRIMRARSLYPSKFKVKDTGGSTYRLKADECAEFCRQLSSMLSSGITAVRAMEILKERDYKPKLKSLYEKMYRDIQQGIAMSEAMRSHGDSFPPLLVNMFASGESSGKLENVAERMALHFDKEHKLNGKIKSATRYPKILCVITLIVVVVIFTVVLPNFFDMLQEFDVIPLITRIVIALSNFIILRYYVIIVAALVLIVLVRYLLALPKLRLKFDKLKLRLPVIGKLLKTIYTARFSRTLSSLYSSGVSMISSLEITGTIIINKYIESQFPKLVSDVRNGESLSDSIRKIDGFDNKLPNTILIGEESGRLDSMLVSTADAFEYEAEQASSALVAYSEPVMIVVMGAIIIVVLLSVMLPMADIYESFGM